MQLFRPIKLWNRTVYVRSKYDLNSSIVQCTETNSTNLLHKFIFNLLVPCYGSHLGKLTFSFFWKTIVFSFSYLFLFRFPIVLKTIVFFKKFLKRLFLKWSENETKNDRKTKKIDRLMIVSKTINDPCHIVANSFFFKAIVF